MRRRYGRLLQATDDGVFDECTRTIIRQVDALKNMVNEFQTFARLPAADLVPEALNDVVEETLVREQLPAVVMPIEPRSVAVA